MWLSAIGSIASVEQQTLNPGRLTQRLPGIDWILQLTDGGQTKIDSHFWQTAAAPSRASRASMRHSCQSKRMRRSLGPIFGAASTVCQWSRRVEVNETQGNISQTQFCQLTVINDFDTLQQAEVVFCISGGRGFSSFMFGDGRMQEGRETELGLKT